jgi:sulfatase modifying factor 1
MNVIRSLFGSVAILVCLASTSQAVTIQYVPVGNPGNPGDTTGFGAVPYSFSIDKYDVTNSQYAEFLNTKDPTGANTLGLWNNQMADATYGGINFDAGNADGSKYAVITGTENDPVIAVNWYDAIRFANWLNNGQGNGDTEMGAYTLGPLGAGGVPINGNSITRNAGARVFLPSENEWYKAAYYDPATGSYFQYPTSSNTLPIGSSPTPLANHANFFPGGPFTHTEVGAYSGTTSPYGAFDMAGNVWQYDEALISSVSGLERGIKGGSFFGIADESGSVIRSVQSPDSGDVDIGFRVASIPEPSSLALCGLGAISLLGYMLRRSLVVSGRARHSSLRAKFTPLSRLKFQLLGPPW